MRRRFKVINRYLKLRAKSWWYVRRVPCDVKVDYGRATIEKSLRTVDVHLARSSRDKINSELERAWQRLRDRRGYLDPQGHIIIDHNQDTAQRAYGDFQRWSLLAQQAEACQSPAKAVDQEAHRLAPSQAELAHPSDPYIDDYLDRVHGLSPHQVATFETSKQGKRLLRTIDAAQGFPPFPLVAKEFLKVARIAPSTRQTYARTYRLFQHLPSPAKVTKDEARQALQSRARVSPPTRSGPIAPPSRPSGIT